MERLCIQVLMEVAGVMLVFGRVIGGCALGTWVALFVIISCLLWPVIFAGAVVQAASLHPCGLFKVGLEGAVLDSVFQLVADKLYTSSGQGH